MNIYILAFLLLFHPVAIVFPVSPSSPLPVCQLEPKGEMAGTTNIVFKSKDGGQTWQDISNGLPENLQEDDIQRDGFLATDNGLFLHVGEGIYHNKPNSEAPFWEKVSGKTWKQVHTGGDVNMVESNGVQIATDSRGITRSEDAGKTWSLVISEGGVGIDVELIEGGFAAINYSSATKSRRVRTSYDGGKTWQPIDAGLPADLSIASIIQVGESFFCGHPKGIYKSSDKGKTWTLILPSVDGKVFNLSVSGNVIYAIPRNGGC